MKMKEGEKNQQDDFPRLEKSYHLMDAWCECILAFGIFLLIHVFGPVSNFEDAVLARSRIKKNNSRSEASLKL